MKSDAAPDTENVNWQNVYKFCIKCNVFYKVTKKPVNYFQFVV